MAAAIRWHDARSSVIRRLSASGGRHQNR